MDAKTLYLENALLNGVLRNIPYTPPGTVYAGLFTADPGEAGSQANEVSGGSYTRIPVTFGVPSGGTCSNTGILSFPLATALWGTVTHAAILDAATLGNMLYKGALASSKTVDIGDTVSYAIGAFTVSET
jgi:hypothetical protein